jgi:membrane protein
MNLFKTLVRFKPIRLVILTIQAWYEDNALGHGAALAYYAVFSISPIVLLSVAMAGACFGEEDAKGRITRQLQSTLGPTVAEAVERIIASTQKSGSNAWAGAIGIAVLIFSAMGFFSQLQSALNAIWKVRPKPGMGWLATVKARFLAFLAVFGTCLLLLTSLVASASLSAVAGLLPANELSSNLHVWQSLTLCGFFLCLTLAFALLFQYLPDAEIAWRHVWLGAAASAGLFIFGNYLIGLYLRWSGTSSAYGAAGSFVLILLWAYYSAQIMLFGAEFTQVYANSSGRPVKPASYAELTAPTPVSTFTP